jgi:hypothetical protein
MKVWNDAAKEWLEVISMNFGPGGGIVRISAKVPGSDALRDGFFDLHGEDLQHIGFGEFIFSNTHLIPGIGTEKEPVEE